MSECQHYPNWCDCAVDAQRRYLLALLTGPVLRADAIVVLCGEDGEKRSDVAIPMLQTAAPCILLSGGRHEPPRHLGASHLRSRLIGLGIKPDRIIADDGPQNTREQADAVLNTAKHKGWKRVLLVASPYHMPRAHLTFVQALKDVFMDETLHVLPVPASQTRWGEPLPGADGTRMDQLAPEFAKIDAYEAKGDVASYEDGLAYLLHWEGK